MHIYLFIYGDATVAATPTIGNRSITTSLCIKFFCTALCIELTSNKEDYKPEERPEEVQEMAEDMAEFLWIKFLDVLQETETELFSGFTLNSRTAAMKSRFRAIKETMEATNCKERMCSSSMASEWLNDVNDALAEYRIFAQQMKAFNRNWVRFNLITEFYFVHKMKDRLNTIKKRLVELKDGNFETPPRILPTTRPTLGHRSEDKKIVGFDGYKEKIEKILFEDGFNDDGVRFKAIGLFGMGGTGKTTLAKEVFNSERVRKEFSKRIWLCLSDFEDDEKDVGDKIVKFLLEETDYDIDESFASNFSLIEILEILNRQLSDGRYLIVLDNVWHVDHFYANLDKRLPEETRATIDGHFSLGLPRGCGGAVIVTSRLEDVAARMVGKKHLIHLQPLLDQNDCWKIFEHSITKSSINKEGPIKYEIMYQCHGLPFAATTLAKIISEIKS